MLATNSTLINPITPEVLAKTLFFQIGIIGLGVVIIYLKVIPYFAYFQGMHLITDDEITVIRKNRVLRLIFKNAKRWYDHVWYSLVMTVLKAGAVILLIGTLGILLTDVGWMKAIQEYVYTVPTNCVNPGSLNPQPYPCNSTEGWLDVLLFARASGQPNGAHLLSYIPLPLLGVYVAWKYRHSEVGNQSTGAVFLGILVIAFGVAVHETVWLFFYFLHYYPLPGFLTYGNQIEDLGFTIAMVLLIYAFWKYKFRPMKMWAFWWPFVGYVIFMFVWFWIGIPVSTINNYALGQGPFQITQWWADPFVNGVEILSWNFIALTFGLAIRFGERKTNT